MRDLVPGGYIFTHLIFWTVVGMVAVGTNAVERSRLIRVPLWQFGLGVGFAC